MDAAAYGGGGGEVVGNAGSLGRRGGEEAAGYLYSGAGKEETQIYFKKINEKREGQ